MRVFGETIKDLAFGEIHGNTLSAANTHRDHSVFLICSKQLVKYFDGQDTTGSADRMANGDTAAVDIYLGRIKPKVTGNGECLACKGFINFEHVNVFKVQIQLFC